MSLVSPVRFLPVLLLAVVMMAPAGAASHWATYYELRDPHAGATTEDDGAVIQKAGNTLHGVANQVSPAGREPGDGSLFLDARLATFVGVRDRNTGSTIEAGTEFRSSLASDLTGRSDIILPAQQHLAAWYGEWYDLDGDGVIDDIHDAAGAAPDEFKWRGHATGATVPMIAYILPRMTSTYSAGLGSTQNANVPGSNVFAMEDRTRLDNPEQGWSGVHLRTWDGGFLVTIQTLVIADALPSSNWDPGYRLDDPNALYDVDHYTGLSPEVESLYVSAITAANGTLASGAEPVNEMLRALATIREDATAMVGEGAAGADPVSTTRHTVEAPYLKEPNTVYDDFGGRALFDGIPDRIGGGNAYPGYTDGKHLYFDHFARNTACVNGYATVPSTSVEESVTVSCMVPNYGTSGAAVSGPSTNLVAHTDPVGANRGSRGTTNLFTFHSFLLLWQDTNGDAHVGRVCDTATADFDAAANACTNAPFPWPGYPNQETSSICESADAKGRSLTVSPMSGAWPAGTILVKDYAEPTRQAFTPSWTVLTGSAPATVRWSDTCILGTAYPSLHARDALLIPDAIGTSLFVVGQASLAAYEDAGSGVIIGPETIVDVDVLIGSL